jgi:type VI secretion system secreted protein VgrG
VAYRQANRLLSVTTALGGDELILSSFHGSESISRPFRFNLEMSSEDSNIAFDSVVGKDVTVKIQLADGGYRYFNGLVSRFSQGGTDTLLTTYRAELVPWLWLLTRTADCKIFQNMTVPAIISKVFTDLGFNNFRQNLRGTYSPLVYCVQYRETAFNFVSRLMEEYGIFYYFEHEEKKHTLVMADHTAAHQVCPNQATAAYEGSGGGTSGEDLVSEWLMEKELQTGKYALADYNFEMPTSKLGVNVAGSTHFEVYDYPGRYSTRDLGDALVKVRLQEAELPTVTIRGGGTCRAFTSGYRFTLEEHPRQDMNRAYVLTSVMHDASQGGYMSGDGGDFSYRNTFVCIPNDVPYRPARTAVKPLIQGSQTAVVVGPSGEEIYIDKYGRVKLQFHWDREGKSDEHSSCWVRVAQNWAGKNWGAIFHPRMGQEVIVDFEEGDPDRPIVTGRVYNASQTVPYDLPGNGTRSTIKTRSSKSGTGDNFNEIRFEDKKGQEELYVHAEKDYNIVVEHDRTEDVGHDRSLRVGHDKKETVENDKTVGVTKNHTETIGENMSITVNKDRTMTVQGNLNESIDKDQNTSVAKNLTTEVGENENRRVGKSQKLDVNENMTVAVVKKYAMKAKSVAINAEDEITLKTGEASISMKKNGDITIKGKKITIKGSGDVVVKGSKITEN